MKHLQRRTGVRTDPAPGGVPGRIALLLGGVLAVGSSIVVIAGCGSASTPTTRSAPSATPSPVISASGVAAGSVQETTGTHQGRGTTARAGNTKVVSRAGNTNVVSRAGNTKVVSPAGKSEVVVRHDRHGTKHSAAPKIVRGNPVHRPAPGTGGNSANDDRPAGKASAADSGTSGPKDPCLVSRAQAQAFTGTRVAAPKLAPLGPTCVYTAKGGKVVTVAIESTVFGKLKPHIQKLTHYTVGKYAAYCGVYGSPNTYVVLPQDRILVVAAPCDVGRKFATAAVAKLHA
jgi:hypothetical protein